MSLRRWLVLMARSVVAGAGAGIAAAGLIFFGFGFIGLEGGDVGERLRNGWDAATSFGIIRGLVLGIGIAVGLAVAFLIWSALTDRFDPAGARPWLAATAAFVVVIANTGAITANGGWDEAAVTTVIFMAVVAAAAVWWTAPWVLRSAE